MERRDAHLESACLVEVLMVTEWVIIQSDLSRQPIACALFVHWQCGLPGASLRLP